MFSEPTFNNTESSIESMKARLKTRLKAIIYSELTVENIEDFANIALDDLINLNNDILKEYRESKDLKPLTGVSVREQEDDAYNKLGLPDIQEILGEILEVGDKIKKLKKELEDNLTETNKVITPAESRPIPVGEGGIEHVFLPRLLTLIYILSNNFGLELDSIGIIKGTVTPDMFRQEPYYRVDIPDLERLVYICDEKGNVSYVFDSERIKKEGLDMDDIDINVKNQKNELIKKYPGIGVRMVQSSDWRRNVSIVLKDNIPVEVSIDSFELSPDREPKSEFRRTKRETIEWLPFDEFTEEVRRAYPGGGLARYKWFQKEKNNHPGWCSNPEAYYKDLWVSWVDLLPDTGKWSTFNVFREEVRQCYKGEKSFDVWYQVERKKHSNWPATPDKVYAKTGWISIADLIERKSPFLDFEDLKKEVRDLYANQRPITKWYRSMRVNHPNWPATPHVVYGDKGWEGWERLVDAKKTRNIERKPFTFFKEEVLGFYNGESDISDWYRQESLKHDSWPRSPDSTYSDEWMGFPDLVSKESRLRRWSPFDDFKTEVLSLYNGEKNIWKWYHKERKDHLNWPNQPSDVYKDSGWEGYPELVNRENMFKRYFDDFDDFRRDVKEFYPGGPIQEWYSKEYKKHEGWPSDPNRVYKNKGWVSFGDIVL